MSDQPWGARPSNAAIVAPRGVRAELTLHDADGKEVARGSAAADGRLQASAPAAASAVLRAADGTGSLHQLHTIERLAVPGAAP